MCLGKLSEREYLSISLSIYLFLTLLFRLTEEYNLELQYRKPFLDVWRDEKDNSELGQLSERMGVRDRATGELLMTDEEKEAASKFSHSSMLAIN